MREFIYYSGKARTSGNFDDLMQAGRIDIACHAIINAFFISKKLRQDVKLHLIFYGAPTPPRHLEMFPGKAILETSKFDQDKNFDSFENSKILDSHRKSHFRDHQESEKARIPETGKEAGKEQLDISKKDISNLIKKMLFKYKEGRKIEVWNGFYIEKKNLNQLIEELKKQGKTIYILDKDGEDIRNAEISENPVFILGDNQGFPAKELKRLKKISIPISVGKKTYFASQIVTIVNNELDKREERGE